MLPSVADDSAMNSNKKPLLYVENLVWHTFPRMVKWLQKERNTCKTGNHFNLQLQNRGFNATIILLSATCIEGFLVECLLSYTIGSIYPKNETFEGRLEYSFREKTLRATFSEFRDLFKLAMGQPLDELVPNKKLIEGVQALISFRNGLAHGRSVSFKVEKYGSTDNTVFEMGSQYKNVHAYLKKQKIVFSDENIISNDIADHFAALIKPYIDAVVPLLPVPQSDSVKILVSMAFNEQGETNPAEAE
jgi:hypothetical protein